MSPRTRAVTVVSDAPRDPISPPRYPAGRPAQLTFSNESNALALRLLHPSMCDLGAQSKLQRSPSVTSSTPNATAPAVLVKVASGTLEYVADDRGAEELSVGKHQ